MCLRLGGIMPPDQRTVLEHRPHVRHIALPIWRDNAGAAVAQWRTNGDRSLTVLRDVSRPSKTGARPDKKLHALQAILVVLCCAMLILGRWAWQRRATHPLFDACSRLSACSRSQTAERGCTFSHVR